MVLLFRRTTLPASSEIRTQKVCICIDLHPSSQLPSLLYSNILLSSLLSFKIHRHVHVAHIFCGHLNTLYCFCFIVLKMKMNEIFSLSCLYSDFVYLHVFFIYYGCTYWIILYWFNITIWFIKRLRHLKNNNFQNRTLRHF